MCKVIDFYRWKMEKQARLGGIKPPPISPRLHRRGRKEADPRAGLVKTAELLKTLRSLE